MERVFKKELRLDKILPCMLIAMFAIMCLFGSSVYATDVYSDGNIYTLNPELDSYKYVLSLYCNGYCHIVCSDSPLVSVAGGIDGGGNVIYYLKNTNDSNFYYKSVWWTNSSNIPTYTLNDFSPTTCVSSTFTIPTNWTEDNHVMATYDIKDTDGNVVFQVAPQTSQEVQQGIVTAKTVEQIQPTVLETMEKVLPIAITILALLIALRILPKVLLRFR